MFSYVTIKYGLSINRNSQFEKKKFQNLQKCKNEEKF